MSAAEKLELIPTTDLVVVDTKPAVLKFNYEEMRARLESELERYDVVVTSDTVVGAKKLATELNKNASELSKRRREAIESVSAPIKLFDEQVKSLEKICKDGRQRLLDQVKTFEDQTRALALETVTQKVRELWESYGVDHEYRQARIDDLINLSTLTAKGSITAKVLNELTNRVLLDKSRQDQTEKRLLVLENESYKHGLSAPLTRAHVETFLFDDDASYQEKLASIMASELERERIAQDRMKAKMEREQAQREADEAARVASAAKPEPEPEPEPVREEKQAVEATESLDVQRFAYGPLSDASKAKMVKSIKTTVFDSAIQLSQIEQEPIGIWVPGRLISIAYLGDIFTLSESHTY